VFVLAGLIWLGLWLAGIVRERLAPSVASSEVQNP